VNKKGEEKMPARKLAHTWGARTDRILFPVSEKSGGLPGVKLILTTDNATTLASNLRKCVRIAEANNEERVELHAYWGHRMPKGYQLQLKVYLENK
jgi:hypothetical protein